MNLLLISEHGDYISGLFSPENKIKEYSQKNHLSIFESAKNLSEEKPDDVLLKVTYLSMEKGYLNENFEYVKQPSSKPKLK